MYPLPAYELHPPIYRCACSTPQLIAYLRQVLKYLDTSKSTSTHEQFFGVSRCFKIDLKSLASVMGHRTRCFGTPHRLQKHNALPKRAALFGYKQLAGKAVQPMIHSGMGSRSTANPLDGGCLDFHVNYRGMGRKQKHARTNQGEQGSSGKCSGGRRLKQNHTDVKH